MKQIPSSPSTKKISDLIGMIKRGELILQPSFQRKLVWNLKHKESFIDTILNGYPFPEIYIAQSGIDIQTFQAKQVVVDGQQRLSTILNYLEGVDMFKNIPKFCALDEEIQKSFLSYDVVVRDLKDASEETIKEIFRRINQTNYKLLDIEINNAIYDGEFITTAKEILDSISQDDIPIFSDDEISRMADLNYVLLLMSTIQANGYFANDKDIKKYIVQYDEFYEDKEQIKKRLLNTFSNIRSLKLNFDSMWYRKSNYFTLFIETTLRGCWPTNLKEKLDNFEKNVIMNKDYLDTDFGKYYASMYTGTNSRTSRVTRGEIFYKFCLN